MEAEKEVSNISVLLEKLYQSPLLFQLGSRLHFADPQRILLQNLQGSSVECMLSALMMQPATRDLNHLLIVNDAEEAAYFHNTLENLTRALDLFYFPSSFKNRKNFCKRLFCLTLLNIAYRKSDLLGVLINLSQLPLSLAFASIRAL